LAAHIETKIAEGFAARLAALVFTPALPIAWPNVAFTPPASGKYLRANHLPNTTSQISLGTSGQNRHIGLYQIDVLWPLNSGDTAPKEIAGAIAAHFKRGTEFTRETVLIRIPSPPSIAPALVGSASYQIPVTVSYLADVAN